MIRKLIPILLLIVGIPLFGAQLSLSNSAVDQGAVTTVDLSMTNTGAVTAMQFDVNIPTGFTFESVALTNRKADHTLSSSMVNNNLLRVVIYSATQSSLSGTSGAVVQLSLKASDLAGNYSLSLSNAIVTLTSGSTESVTTSNSTLTINGVKAVLGTSSLSFGKVANGTKKSMSISVSNGGNQAYTITSATLSDSRFTVETALPITVAGNSSRSITVSFLTSSGDVDVKDTLSLSNSDPSALRNQWKIPLSATAFSSNVITVGSVSGKMGSVLTLPISLSNAANVSGVQLEVVLPDSALYKEGSLTIGSRVPSSFQLSANQIGKRLILLLYGNDNSTIVAGAGTILSFSIQMNNYAGSYSLSYNRAVVSNAESRDVFSGITLGSVTLTAPRLSYPSSIDFGQLNVSSSSFDKSVTLSNTGNEPLVISGLSLNNSLFQLSGVSLPITLSANQSTTFTTKLVDKTPGSKSAVLTISSNDPLRVRTVPIAAQMFAYYEVDAVSQSVLQSATSKLEFALKNDLAATAVQFDATLPSLFTYNMNAIEVATRANGWTVSASKLTNGNYRFTGFSSSQTSVTGNNGTIFSVPFTVPASTATGAYGVSISNVIISNPNNQNVATGFGNGTVTVMQGTVGIDQLNESVIITASSRAIIVNTPTVSTIELYSLSGVLITTLRDQVGCCTIPLQSPFVGIVRVVSDKNVICKKIVGR